MVVCKEDDWFQLLIFSAQYMCGRAHAATLANTTTLKIYPGQGINTHYDPNDAPLMINIY